MPRIKPRNGTWSGVSDGYPMKRLVVGEHAVIRSNPKRHCVLRNPYENTGERILLPEHGFF
jgi:hypothetical protein